MLAAGTSTERLQVHVGRKLAARAYGYPRAQACSLKPRVASVCASATVAGAGGQARDHGHSRQDSRGRFEVRATIPHRRCILRLTATASLWQDNVPQQCIQKGPRPSRDSAHRPTDPTTQPRTHTHAHAHAHARAQSIFAHTGRIPLTRPDLQSRICDFC